MIIKKEDYQKYADCIQMEQMAAPEIAELFEDEKFHKWYKSKYRNPYTKEIINLGDDPNNHDYE